MTDVLQDVQDAVSELQTGQAAIGDELNAAVGTMTLAVAEIQKLADKLASGVPGPTEIADIAGRIRGVTAALQTKVDEVGASAAALKTEVNTVDPSTQGTQ